MNCKKVASYIPDYISGNLSENRKKLVEQHLSVCANCQSWAEEWRGIRNFSAQVIHPPADLDWEPFDRAIDAELERNPAPVRRRFSLSEVWDYIRGELWNFPRILPLRLSVSVAAVCLVVFLSGHLDFFPQSDQPPFDLTLADHYYSEQDGEISLYAQGQENTEFYHEVINVTSVEGKDYNY